MTTLDQPIKPVSLRAYASSKLRFASSSKLAKMLTLTLVVCVLANTPAAVAQPAQPVRNAEVIELAPKTSKAQPTKIALVIGNAQYTDAGKLGNPVNDATDLAEKLKAVGFTDPIVAINQTTAQFKQTLKTFRSRLRPNAEVVVYYAGHGMSVDGTNYLLPVDVKLESKADLRDEAISLKNIIEDLNAAQIKTSILILDSCRNNPFSRGWKGPGRDIIARGWSSEAVASAAAGIKIFYATKDGEVANDGAGRNGHFTSSLLRHIDTPGMSLNDMIDQVTSDLHLDPKVKQTPWSEGSMIGAYYFKPPAAAVKNASLIAKVLTGDTQAIDEWLKNDTNALSNLDKLMSQLRRKGDVISEQLALTTNERSLESTASSPSQTSTPIDKQTAAVVLAQEQSEDASQRQLGAAMTDYLSNDKNSIRNAKLVSKLQQGNVFAALMLHELEVTKTGKSSVLIHQNLLKHAEKEIDRLSQSGDLVAISWNANIHKYGLLGKTIDLKKALELMLSAAIKNYPYAQTMTGFLYQGFRDGEKAKSWFLKAIENGDTNSMVGLGWMFQRANLIPQNLPEALKLYQLAANNNNQYAQRILGTAYMAGELGLKPNGELGKSWFLKAIENGNTDAMVHLGSMLSKGELINKDETEALKLYRKASDEGNHAAQLELGSAYRLGRLGLNTDGEQAKSWYLMAMNNGNIEAMDHLGYMYETGAGVSKDDAEALKYYMKAADSGSTFSQLKLANAYRKGKLGLTPSGEKAKNWYLNAINNEDNSSTQAIVELAYMYDTGQGILKDQTQAFELYKRAAYRENATAIYNLAVMHLNGEGGLTVDKTEANRLFRKAADLGDEDAIKFLAK
jgi:uncharacterized protein